MRLALALLLVPAIAFAQSGALEGTVVDANGFPLPGATVIVTSELADQQVVQTDEHGAYAIADLPPGAYKLTIYYADEVQQIDVELPHAAVTITFKPIAIGRVNLDYDRSSTPPLNPNRTFASVLAAAQGTVETTAVPGPSRPRPQVQADLGLAVIGAAYEHPIGEHYALQIEAQAFSTYFAPWFSAGDRVDGFGGQLRPTWFRDADHHGLYVAPYVRVDRVTHDMAAGVGFAAGGFAGYAFGAGPLDIRVGAGAQYMRYFAGPFGLSTPFVALDLVVGYRL